LKIFDFGTGDAIVRNDEVVGSIPTSSAFLNDLQARICGYVPPRSNSVHHSWLLTRSPSMAIVRRHCSLSRFRDALRVDFLVGPIREVPELMLPVDFWGRRDHRL